MKKRTLSLRRETIGELTIGDLRNVVGGASGISCPLRDCVTDVSEAVCPSQYNCPTWEGC